ncbi:helix-turn-helix domain-containing protein [Amycolatopsis rhizosphaerae]|uniref:Helix-turn-helix domain-containing protein n=1 Tax=Amycolatopsis rhizosphaerae TaxID=2053003 RepID=A0A558CU74_9PSEU|nr:XRE family transcriptional regulator [Amycolatopsis rhizosphaerae]TVT52331.1 helix-turn-helix domain-containing protein [Amycolatopsis rhizosphaerae]
MRDDLDRQLADRLSGLRAERGWSLERLAEVSGVSRSTLSRIERAEISPTAALLGRLCTAYGRSMSQLLSEVEADPPVLLRAADQPVWTDPETGFTRRSVSPPQPGLRAEVLEGVLPAGAVIAYQAAARPGQEQHLWLTEGVLELTVGGELHELRAGDCLRFHVRGGTRFHSPGPGAARYTLVIVLP